MSKYPIEYQARVVGNAEIQKKGLYCQIYCNCTLDHDDLYRIYILGNDKKTDLGICIRESGVFTLQKSLPAKELPEGELHFQIVEKEERKIFYPIIPNQPFLQLKELEDCVLHIDNGVVGAIKVR